MTRRTSIGQNPAVTLPVRQRARPIVATASGDPLDLRRRLRHAGLDFLDAALGRGKVTSRHRPIRLQGSDHVPGANACFDFRHARQLASVGYLHGLNLRGLGGVGRLLCVRLNEEQESNNDDDDSDDYHGDDGEWQRQSDSASPIRIHEIGGKWWS